MDGSNKRGRPHREWSGDIEQWCGTTLQELSHAALNRQRWAAIVKMASDTNGHWAHGCRWWWWWVCVPSCLSLCLPERKKKGNISVNGLLVHAGPVASVLVNRFGCRIVSIVGSIIAGVFFAISQFSPSIDVLIFTYGVMGGQLYTVFHKKAPFFFFIT